eukprot:871313-Pelagomonas_calceolata.AAC.8
MGLCQKAGQPILKAWGVGYKKGSSKEERSMLQGWQILRQSVLDGACANTRIHRKMAACAPMQW